MKRKILISLCAVFLLCGAQAQKLLDAASGMYHTLLLFEDGKILAFGYNSYGQLGLGFESGHADSIYEPLPSSCEPPAYVDSPVKFVSVAAGETHSIAVARDGTLWGWGCNGSGQLGNCIAWYKEKNHVPNAVSQPILLNQDKDWAKVFADGDFSFALKKDGTLWRICYKGIEKIEHPANAKWKNIEINNFYLLGDSYVYMVAEDAAGNFWTWGECNSPDSMCLSFSAWRGETGEFDEMMPLTLPKGTSDFSTNSYAGAYRKGGGVYLWGASLIDEKNIVKEFYENIKKEIWLADNVDNMKREDVGKVKRLITGNFLTESEILCEIVEKSNSPEYNMKHGAYTAALLKSGMLILWTDGKKFESGENLEIQRVFGKYNLFSQSKDGTIYVTGYDIYGRAGLDCAEDSFLFLEPLQKVEIRD